ncbi:damage-inducible protein DinB [Rhizobium sp. ARZ01]|uniref:DinB family protein n=1 Tax=Rhizobium sp. ARZ01 TaxID=2769313 RepID=UPI0017863A60|nr:DinB family protein [Rhizobium sp. ARZ01]MBD9371717.1 damage-inducible protein DinB [Rhizobium sp. ARZ01]
MLNHYKMFAAYNAWANRILYAEAAALSPSALRENKGAFFGSLHGTLNHILVADRIWMRRFTGSGDVPARLDAVLYDDIDGLRHARIAEDQGIIDWIGSLDEKQLADTISYVPLTNPVQITQPLGPALAHFFNHQTHHRGQCHAILTSLGRPSLVLDLVYFLRAEGAEWMRI